MAKLAEGGDEKRGEGLEFAAQGPHPVIDE